VQGPSHLLVSWYFAEACRLKTPRERRIVAWAGFAPDFDVLAYGAALLYYRLDKDLAFENVWRVVHHRYTHGIGFVLVVGVAAWALAGRGAARARVAGLAMLAAALHCFFDVALGGAEWPIYPWWPFSDLRWYAVWSWGIGEWPNIVILFACLAGMIAWARRAGRSPMECFGDRAGAWLVRVARQGGGAPAPASRGRRWLIWLAIAALVAAVLAPLGFNPWG